MPQLSFSASFEYLHACYGSTANINIILFQCRDRLYTSEGPRAERVPALKLLAYTELTISDEM